MFSIREHKLFAGNLESVGLTRRATWVFLLLFKFPVEGESQYVHMAANSGAEWTASTVVSLTYPVKWRGDFTTNVVVCSLYLSIGR